jgi:cyclin B
VSLFCCHLQKGYAVNSQYMDGYSIRPTMRTILVDWLVDVHGRFKMLQETLYLTVSVMDSFLQVTLQSVFVWIC